MTWPDRTTASDRAALTLGLVMLACLSSSPALAIEVEQVLWGFDGQAVAGRFNPLSVEFSNPTSQPFDGTVALRRSAGGIGGRSGLEIVQQVYLGPFESARWVQFYAYVPTAWESWTLSWPGRRYDLPTPLQRERQDAVRVLLYDADTVLRRSGSMKQFPDHLFPPLSTATDTLDVAVLGHVPRWQEPRQRAFHDWLHRGGTLHLVTDDSGRFPSFTEALAELNNPAERFLIGRGFVYRHQRPRARIDADFVETVIAPARNPALGQGESHATADGGADAELEATAEELRRRQLAADSEHIDHAYFEEGFVDTAFSELKEITRPDHNWALIYPLAIIYIALIFPGCYALGLKRVDYRLVYAALLGTVALFSVVFAWVGRRGYGEATAVNSVAIARALPDGHWDVTGWSNAFVTSGDTYRVGHAGSGVLYSTAQSNEAVAGRIVNGPGAELVADIPAFSSRPFVYRTKISLPDATVRVLEWNTAADDPQIVLAAAGPLRGPAPTTGGANWPAWAIYGNAFYTLDRPDDQRLVLRVSRGQPLSTYAATLLSLGPEREYWFSEFDEQRPAEERYRSLQTPLVVRSLSLAKPGDLKSYSLPADRVRLFLVAPWPEALLIDNAALGKQAGQVVFTLDVARPEHEAGQGG
jgi:hypothetical protein